MESLPFALFISLLIASFVLVISFNQLQNYNVLKEGNEMIENYNKLSESVKMLYATGGKGSFERVHLEIPKGYKLYFNENEIIIVTPTKNITNVFNNNFTTNFGGVLHSGKYNVVIYYGKENEFIHEKYIIYIS